ncbi:MAG: aromatic amino acid transport family protein [Gammaproteobacteria bacterium]
MLALPLTSAATGLVVAISLLIICWLFTYLTATLVLEINLWLDGEPSYISMAQQTLGRGGAGFAWLCFLLMFYSLLAAYIDGGGALLQAAMQSLFAKAIPGWLGALLWALLFYGIVFLGTTTVDYVNRLFTLSLVIAYALLMVVGLPQAQLNFAIPAHSSYLIWASLPVLITSFGYHIIIPTVRHYLRGNLRQLLRVLWWGSIAILSIYVLWDCLVFGILPNQGPHSLINVLNSGEAVTGLTNAISSQLAHSFLPDTIRFFAFFALASSFLGVAYGLFDLIADGLKIKKTKHGRILASALTFVPPIIFALSYPQGFILALGYAGMFVAILHGLLPIAMVVAGRRKFANIAIYQAPGKWIGLIAATLFFSIVIFADLAMQLHWLSVG